MKPFLSFTSEHSQTTDPGSLMIRDVLTMDKAAGGFMRVAKKKIIFLDFIFILV